MGIALLHVNSPIKDQHYLYVNLTTLKQHHSNIRIRLFKVIAHKTRRIHRKYVSFCGRMHIIKNISKVSESLSVAEALI